MKVSTAGFFLKVNDVPLAETHLPEMPAMFQAYHDSLGIPFKHWQNLGSIVKDDERCEKMIDFTGIQ